MFLEEVIPAFQSCQNPQNTQRCKFDACCREEGIGLNIRGQGANYRRNEQEHWRYILRIFFKETKFVEVVHVMPNVLIDTEKHRKTTKIRVYLINCVLLYFHCLKTYNYTIFKNKNKHAVVISGNCLCKVSPNVIWCIQVYLSDSILLT